MRYLKLLITTALAVFCLAGCVGRTSYEETGSSTFVDVPAEDTIPDGHTPPSPSSATAEEDRGTAISHPTTAVGSSTDTPEVGTTTDGRTSGVGSVTTVGSTATVRTTDRQNSTPKKTSGATTSGVDNWAEDPFAPTTTAGRPGGVTTRSSAAALSKATVSATVTTSKAVISATSTTKAVTTEKVTATEKVTTTQKADTTKEEVTTVTTTGSTTRRSTRRTSDDPNWSPFY